MRRSYIDIRKAILELLLKHQELTLRELESKVNTSTQTIKTQVADLQSLGFIEVKNYKAHPRNNKPYKTCKILQRGIEYIKTF